MFHSAYRLSALMLKSEGRRKKKRGIGTLEGSREVYDVFLLMDYLFCGPATERGGKVTRA